MVVIWWVGLFLNVCLIVILSWLDSMGQSTPSWSTIIWAALSSAGFIKLYSLARKYDHMGRT